MPNSRYDPADSRYWEEPESNEDLDSSYYWADDPAEDDEPDDDSPGFECGFIPGYGCQLAGTEDCDWECPHSHKLQAHPDYPNVRLAPIGDILAALSFNLEPPDTMVLRTVRRTIEP